jgi:hypothetical protein
MVYKIDKTPYHINIQNKFMAEDLTILLGGVFVSSSSKASDGKDNGSSSLNENTSLSSDALPLAFGISFNCVADMATLIKR